MLKPKFNHKNYEPVIVTDGIFMQVNKNKIP